MIRYDITLEELRTRIARHRPGWIDRARARTDKFRNAGRYPGSSTIVFFGLDDLVARKNLHAMLMKTEEGDADARALVDEMLAPTAPHANCARNFNRLFRSNRPRADEVLSDVVRFLASRSP